MHPNAQLIDTFYRAFMRLDADAMAACYAEDACFDDPVFTLDGRDEVSGMWHMLCDAITANGRDVWQLQFRDVSADDRSGRAHWEAHYRFSATGRRVHNIIDAEFRFADGLIVEHHDRFGLWRWSRQALGPAGVLLGWTPMLRGKVRAQARNNLDRYLLTSR